MENKIKGAIEMTLELSLEKKILRKNLYYWSTFVFCSIWMSGIQENSYSVAKATLQLQMSVCQSVTKTPQPLRIVPIDH